MDDGEVNTMDASVEKLRQSVRQLRQINKAVKRKFKYMKTLEEEVDQNAVLAEIRELWKKKNEIKKSMKNMPGYKKPKKHKQRDVSMQPVSEPERAPLRPYLDSIY